MSAAYYNEYEPYAAEWLRNLIKQGLIADGEVDGRSIVDVRPDDLGGFTQCHFFAGIGVWSYALRLAGWADHRPVWTGSCPCQPFSAAGKGKGFEDERHLWPHFHRLIAECRPAVVFGEQVASKDGLQWLDAVCADMEASGYAIGASDLCAAGIGAPHIRQRPWFVGERLGDAIGSRLEGQRNGHQAEGGWNGADGSASEAGEPDRLANADGRDASAEGLQCSGQQRQQPQDGGCLRLADADSEDQRGRGVQRPGQGNGTGDGSTRERLAGLCADGRLADSIGNGRGARGNGHNTRNDGHQSDADRSNDRPSPTNGNWRDADWLHCRDGKWRPVEARPQPLADGSAESLGRVRSEVGEEIERAIDAAAMESKVSRSSLLRALRESLGARARSVWEAGRLPGLHEAPFLLALLRQLQAQGWAVEEGRTLPREEEQAWIMRVLRGDEAPASASHRRELEEQRARQSADALHLLSSLLARHAQATWGHAYETYAEIGFPIGHESPARVGRLRAYGNAIVPQVAAEVIAAFMEARP